MDMSKPDPLRLGVLLLGVAAILMASVILHAYYTGLILRQTPGESFYAYCSFRVVIIHANEELKDVRVLKPNGEVICEIKSIARGSDDVCAVPSDGVYIVRVGDVKRAVTCQSAPVSPAPGD